MWSGIVRRNPIGAVLFVTLLDSELSLPAFIAEIGYKHLYKGIRSFHSFVNTGTGNFLLLERLQQSRLALPPEVLLDALTCTEWLIRMEHEEERRRMADEQEARFTPIICPVPALDPGAQVTLFPVGSDYDMYASPLPSTIASWEVKTQFACVQDAIRENYRAHNGSVFLLGPIVSYLYWRRFHEPPLLLSREGKPLGIAPHRALPFKELGIADTPVRKRLLAQLGCSDDMAVLH